MRRGGCDVPVVATPVSLLPSALPLLQLLRCEIKVWRRSARRIPAAGEPFKEDWTDGHEAYKNYASVLQDR